MRIRITRTVLWAAAAIVAAPTIHYAQVSTASIQGTVRDSSGAAIPTAAIVLRNNATNVETNTSTNGAGEYAFVNILPGSYNLRVSKQGFQSAQQSDVTLSVNQTAAYDFTLPVGSAEQTVTVTAAAPTIESSTAELGAVIDTASVNDLPLNGRNFSQLLQLTPGASPINTAQTFGFRGVGATDFPSFHGARNRANLFLVDGINDQVSITSNYAVPPIVDDIQEFKVDAHNDQVQFGGVSGGVVNVVTKAGTNTYHGTAWEYLRNSVFDARNPFFAVVNPLRQNQFGANGGGPVLLPHYNGRNRTFFFVSYEGFRNSTPSQTLGRVPTQSQLAGNLNDLGVAIYDPFTTRPDPARPGQFLRDPFPNNVVPQNLFDPAMAKLGQGLYPAPTGTGTTNYSATAPVHTNQDVYNIRGDQQLGSKNSVWFRFSKVTLPRVAINPIGNSETVDTWHAHTIGANWTHTFGTGTVMQAQFGRTWAIDNTRSAVPNAPAGVISALSPDFACGYPGDRKCLLPSASLTNFLGTPGDTVSDQGASDIWSGQVNLSKLWRKHLFTMGFSINTNNIDELILNNSISYIPSQTADPQNLGRTGSDLASFLLGVPSAGARRLQGGGENHGWVDGFYFGDQWKATSRLTVNWGLRYDLTLKTTWGTQHDDTIYVGVLNANNGTYILQVPTPLCSQKGKAPCIPGTGLPDHVVVAENGHIYPTDKKNFAPRLGLAYRVTSKTVIRAGGGIFYDNWATWTQLGQSYGANWPSVNLLQATNQNPDVITVRAANPLAAIGAGALPAATPFTLLQTYKDPFMTTPYTEEWNFGIQQQLGATTALSVDYVGSHGSRLDLNTFFNTAPPGPGAQPARRPYPYITPTNFERTNGRSSYEALEVSLNRRMSKGLSTLLSYTWGKSLDISCSGWAGVEGCANQDPYNVNADKSVSAYDLTHIFSASVVYELPFGKGKQLASGRGVLDYAIGGWQTNAILGLHSGIPYTLGVSGDIANTGNSNNAGYYERLNVTGDPNLDHPTTAQWFNTKAFAVPANFTYGNLGRNTLRTNWGRNLDLSLFRDFPVRESVRLQFRAEAFNVTNTPVWGTPVSNFSNANFGRVLSVGNTPRQLQLALKLRF
jgi:Carboxypeptidase regulatory-like domain